MNEEAEKQTVSQSIQGSSHQANWISANILWFIMMQEQSSTAKQAGWKYFRRRLDETESFTLLDLEVISEMQTGEWGLLLKVPPLVTI